MGKMSRAKSKLRRLDEKRKRRVAQKALYASYRDSGANSRSYRFRKNAKAVAKARVKHSGGPCRNIGCQRCFPHLPAHPRMNRAQAV